MAYLFIILSFLLFSGNSQAQTDNDHSLNISAEGQVEMPADIIKFNINLNAEADSPQEAYDLHKKREQALVRLLDQYNIKEKDIHYALISISKVNNNNYNLQHKQAPTYQTRQAVNLTLTDFDAYEKIQLALIDNDFDSFNAFFATSKAEQAKDEALKKAIRTAKEKASLIAEEAGVNLGSIKHISYSDNSAQPVFRMEAKAFQAPDAGELMKYDQSVTISTNISIEFELSSDS